MNHGVNRVTQSKDENRMIFQNNIVGFTPFTLCNSVVKGVWV